MNRKYGCTDAFLARTVREIKNEKYDEREVIQLVKAIKILEQHVGMKGDEIFNIPKEHLHLYRKMRTGRWSRQMEKNVSDRRDQLKANHPNDSFSEVKQLREVSRIEDYNEDWSIKDLVDQTKFDDSKKYLFFEYVNSCSTMLRNMMRFPIESHVAFDIILFPLHKFFLEKSNTDLFSRVWGYYGKTSLPEDLNDFTGRVPERVGDGNKRFGVIHGSPLTMRGMMHLYWLKQLHHFFPSETRREIIMSKLGLTDNDDKQKVDEIIGKYRMAYYDSNNKLFQVFDSEQSREIVRQCHQDSMKNLGSAFYGPERKYLMRKHIRYSIEESYANISKWETSLKLLKAAFLSYKPGDSNQTPIKSSIPTFNTNTLGYSGNLQRRNQRISLLSGFTNWGSSSNWHFSLVHCTHCYNPIIANWQIPIHYCSRCNSKMMIYLLYPMVPLPHSNSTVLTNNSSTGLSPEKKAWLDKVISSPDIPNSMPGSKSSQCDKELTSNQDSNADIAPALTFHVSSEPVTHRDSTLSEMLRNADLISFDQILNNQFKTNSTISCDQTSSSNNVGNYQVFRKRANTNSPAIPSKKTSGSFPLEVRDFTVSSSTSNSKQLCSESSGVDDQAQAPKVDPNIDG